MKKKIAVYAIAKNESKFVERWLNSVKDSDYVCVLDMGSTDDTVEKFRSLRPDIILDIYIPDVFRFDEARNKSLELVPDDAEIRLCIDIDEVIMQENWTEVLREHWEEGTEKAIYLYTWNVDEHDRPAVQIAYEKLHNNDPNWYWAMPVHEALTYRGRDKVKAIHIPEEKFEVRHYPDKSKSRGQYIELMRLGVQEHPESYMQNYYLGRELYYYKKYREAIEQLEKTVRLPGSYPANQAAAYGFLGECYEVLEEFKRAEISYKISLSFTDRVREPYIKLLKFYYNRHRWYAMLDLEQDIFAIKGSRTEWYEDTRNYREIPYDYLSIAYWNIGNKEKFYEYANKALEYDPFNDRIKHNLSLMTGDLS